MLWQQWKKEKDGCILNRYFARELEVERVEGREGLRTELLCSRDERERLERRPFPLGPCLLSPLSLSQLYLSDTVVSPVSNVPHHAVTRYSTLHKGYWQRVLFFWKYIDT